MSELRYFPIPTDEDGDDDKDGVSLQHRPLTLDMVNELKSLVQDSTPISKKVCDAVILKLHVSLRENLNLTAILPYLNRSQILDAKCQMEFLQPNSTTGEKCDFLVACLQQSQSDYLKPLVEALLETRTSGVGTSHDELLSEIYNLYCTEISNCKDSSSKCGFHNANSIITVTAIITITFSTIFYIAFVGTLLNVSNFQKESSQVLFGESVITLDSIINNQWVSTVNVRWNESKRDCTGYVNIITGLRCLDSHFVTLLEKAEYFEEYTLPYYALPNSSITILLSDGNSVYIRILQSIKEYMDFHFLQDDGRATVHCEPPTCYYSKNYINSSITFQIFTSDFYYVIITDDNGEIQSNPEFNIKYKIFSFNDTIIRNYVKQHSIKTVYIGDDSPHTIRVSQDFKFSHPTCNLLNFSCRISSAYYPSFVIEDAKFRKDCLILGSLLYAIFISTPIIAVIVCSVRLCRQRKML